VSWHLLKLGIEKKRQSGFQLYSENCWAMHFRATRKAR